MLDLRHTRDWKQALQHVPTRKLKEAREHMLQKKIEKFQKLNNEALVEEKAETKKLHITRDLYTFANRRVR